MINILYNVKTRVKYHCVQVVLESTFEELFCNKELFSGIMNKLLVTLLGPKMIQVSNLMFYFLLRLTI